MQGRALTDPDTAARRRRMKAILGGRIMARNGFFFLSKESSAGLQAILSRFARVPSEAVQVCHNPPKDLRHSFLDQRL
jgi:hypothetical protein